jgi:tetratricopeptide (TPR) repeat protein
MNREFTFRFSLPNVPEGKPVSAAEAEQILLAQLKERGTEEAVWNLARFYSVTGRQQIAMGYVQQLLDATADPEKKAECLLTMGRLMEQIKDYDAAIRFYTQAFAMEPVDNDTWYFINNNLGYCLNHFGRHVEAERYCQTAIGINPNRHNAYKNLGISLQGQNCFSQAARCYVAAVQANASDPRALQHLEQLFAAHPEIGLEQPDIQEQIQACRAAVEVPAQVSRQMQAQAAEFAKLRAAAGLANGAEQAVATTAPEHAPNRESARIAIVQRHEANLEGIRLLLAERPNLNTIEYFQHPSEVLRIIRQRPFDVVISGNVFDSDLTGCGAVGLGTEFARLVKQISPSTLFFMYSIMPERNEFMDGVIPKARGTADRPERHGALVDFVAHPALASMSRNKDRKLLQAAFPYLQTVGG